MHQSRRQFPPISASASSGLVMASIGASMIRDFRGALIGKADKGILLTTGSFTMEAKREAIRDGANPIELVDGEKLVRMFEKLELGVKPKIVYEVDLDFFNEFK